MYINSPGGSLTSMFAIYDVMQYIKPDIVTVGFGQCCSAGSFILASGTKGKRFALPNTEIMLHELSTGTKGKYNEIKNYIKHTDYLYEKMSKYYHDITGQPLERIKKDLERDYYISPSEAKEYGLIDEIHFKRN
jgi:ATP-dependent Clp protease protease subunit